MSNDAQERTLLPPVDPSLEINSKEESTGNPNQDDQNQQQQGGQQAQGGQQGGQNKPGQGGQQQGGQNKPGRQGGQERRSNQRPGTWPGLCLVSESLPELVTRLPPPD